MLFKQLLKSLPKLATQKEASHTVAILEELFEQIDINGDEKVSPTEIMNKYDDMTYDTEINASLSPFPIFYLDQTSGRLG